jgi:hypothetical protein
MPAHRTPDFCRESLEFTREVNAMVTRLLSLRGSTRPIPQEEADPKVEAAAVMLAANLLAITNGDWELLVNEVWPRAAAGNLRQFEAHLHYAEREEQRG